MLAEYFPRDRRLKYNSGIIVIFAIISQAIGWSFISNQYIYRYSGCTYYLSGTQSCPNSPYSYYYSRSDDSYSCNYYDDACIRASKIRSMFVGAIVYPLIYLFYMCLVTGCYYFYYTRRYNCLRCSQVFWIICYFVCMILFFSNASNVTSFANSSSYDVNTNIRDCCIGLGILCIFKLILLCGLNYDLHYYIRETYIIVPSVTIVQNQQPIIIQSGVYNQGPQIVYAGPQYIQQFSIISPNQQLNTYPSQQQTFQGQQMYSQPLYQQQGYAQPIYGQPVYGQPVNGQPLKY